jgi:hypothetical protein
MIFHKMPGHRLNQARGSAIRLRAKRTVTLPHDLCSRVRNRIDGNEEISHGKVLW